MVRPFLTTTGQKKMASAQCVRNSLGPLGLSRRPSKTGVLPTLPDWETRRSC